MQVLSFFYTRFVIYFDMCIWSCFSRSVIVVIAIIVIMEGQVWCWWWLVCYWHMACGALPPWPSHHPRVEKCQKKSRIKSVYQNFTPIFHFLHGYIDISSFLHICDISQLCHHSNTSSSRTLGHHSSRSPNKRMASGANISCQKTTEISSKNVTKPKKNCRLTRAVKKPNHHWHRLAALLRTIMYYSSFFFLRFFCLKSLECDTGA